MWSKASPLEFSFVKKPCMPDLHVSIKDWVNFCLMIFIVSKVENVVIRTHFDPKFLFWERKLKGLRRPLDSITVPQCTTEDDTKSRWLCIITRKPKEFWGPVSTQGFPGGSDGKESVHNEGDRGSIPRSGRSPGEGNGNPLQYSHLKKLRDRGAWWATACGIVKSWTWQRD